MANRLPLRALWKIYKRTGVVTGAGGKRDLAITQLAFYSFAPFPPDMDAVRAIVKAVAPKPVNLLIGTMKDTPPFAELQKAGVNRVSTGVALYTREMAVTPPSIKKSAPTAYAESSDTR